MSDFTLVTGHLGEDARTINHDRGTFITFSVATNRRWKDKDDQIREKTIWYHCISNGVNQAAHLRKGRLVQVMGEVEADAYLNKAGQPEASLKLRTRRVEFLTAGGQEVEEVVAIQDEEE